MTAAITGISDYNKDLVFTVFLAHLSRRLQGELLVYQ